MSSIKEYIAEIEKREALQDLLKVLLDKEIIQHDVSKGIARQIIADGNIDGLSDKQLYSFEKYVVKPFISNVSCKKEGCSQKIDIFNLAEAYESEKFYCVDCAMDMNN